MSWLNDTSLPSVATGNVWANIPDRTTARTEFDPTTLAALSETAARVILSSASTMWLDFMSLGETQGISPSQNAALALLGVPPLDRVATSESFTTVHVLKPPAPQVQRPAPRCRQGSPPFRRAVPPAVRG